MDHFIIIETTDGFEVTHVPDGKTAMAVAKELGSILIDEGPYPTFEAAQDVLMTMPNPYEPGKGPKPAI